MGTQDGYTLCLKSFLGGLFYWVYGTHARVGGSIPSLGTTFSFQVMPSTRENTQKTRLVRVFCCLQFVA
jgi:hypothetical protein